MTAELELRWLKTDNIKGAAKRFAEFCKEDIREQSKLEDFDIGKYQEAVKLVLRKLDNSESVKEMFIPEKQQEADTEAEENSNNAD